MKKPAHVIEIFLQPGEFYFGDRHTRIRTLLGSCVSITMWHPKLLIGGMCHYLLPSRGKGHSGGLDGRYADEAMELFEREIAQNRTRPADYQVKLFGGGNMFPWMAKGKGCADISGKNVLAAKLMATRHGFQVKAEDVGGDGHRQIIFDVWSGHVWVRRAQDSTLHGRTNKETILS